MSIIASNSAAVKSRGASRPTRPINAYSMQNSPIRWSNPNALDTIQKRDIGHQGVETQVENPKTMLAKR